MNTQKNRLLLLSLSLLLLLSFYLFSREVKRGFLKQTDFNTTVKIQDRMPNSASWRIDSLWEDFAFFVEPGPSVFVCGFLTVAALVDIKKKKLRWRALLIPVLFGALVLGETYGKNVVHHPAPPFFMIKNPATIFPKYYINEAYSYPSGHTARAVFFGCVSYSLFLIHNSLFRSKKMKFVVVIGIIGYIFMVGIGRIYLGQHWPSDVIGGGLLGGGLGCLLMGLF